MYRRFFRAPNRQFYANQPSADNRVTVNDQYTPNQFYRVQISMLPSVYQRFDAYRRVPVRQRQSTFFANDDSIMFTFQSTQYGGTVDADVLEQDIQNYITQTGLSDVSGTVYFNLSREVVDGARQLLGGQSLLAQRFDGRPNVSLVDFLDYMEDQQYSGFSFTDVVVIIEVDMSDFVRTQLRGGSLTEFEEACRSFKDIPLQLHYSLAYFDFWNSGQKAIFRKAQQQCGPNHLKDVKGLLFYEWKPDWYPYCGIMACVYSYYLTSTLNVLESYWKAFYSTECSWAQCPDFVERIKEHESVLDCIKRLDELQCGENLYRATCAIIEQHDLHSIAVYPSLQQLGIICQTLFPNYTLVVYDKSRHILFRHQGTASARLCDPPLNNFKKGELTSHYVKQTTLQRICIFYDHVLEHFLPIYNLSSFLQRRVLDIAYRVQSLSSLNEAGTNQNMLYHTKDRKMSYCPFCDAGIYEGKEPDHACNLLRCYYCDEPFSSARQYMTHCNPNKQVAPHRCKICRQLCFGKTCLKHHEKKCDKKVYLTCHQCQRMVLSKHRYHHKCRSYTCGSCKKSVINPVVYQHPDHPEGYVKYHPCAMTAPTIKQEKHDNALYFSFDFESMLTANNYNDMTIHVHTVNCVSIAPIIVDTAAQSDDLETLTNAINQKTVSALDLFSFWDVVCSSSTAENNYWFAHNFQGYDGRLFFDFLTHDIGIVPLSMIRTGGKILKLVLKNPETDTMIIFQDSLCHIPSSLANMPKMFGLDTSIIKKGFFPYMFNLYENQNYIGSIPEQSYFNVTKIKNRAAFDSWYTTYHNEHDVYDFKKEMIEYCENDVLILSLAMSRYMGICLQYSHGMIPLPFLTIAQYVFQIYRCHYLPKNTIYYLDESYDVFARKALHGGNTNVRRLYYECTPEEAGTFSNGQKGCRYIDVQSLYPTVQFYDPLPVGCPSTYFYYESDQPSLQRLQSFFGFIECDLEVKTFTFHPLIARFKNNRLFMDLHPQKRCVLTSVEFQKAVFHDGGYYKCTRVYRIDEYQKSYELFKPFIRNWLRLKIISSSAPPLESFTTYQAELYTRLGIHVEYTDFKPNPSLRTLAKLVLNSLWGKFGQRTSLPESKILHTASEIYDYYEKIRMGIIMEKGHQPIGNVAFMKKFVRPGKWNKKNVAIAAFVTANARLRLWEVMDKLGDRVLYHDTDSVIYERCSQNDTMIQEGCFLGDWESETGDRMIYQFVGLAPKTYAYRYINSSGEMVECVKSKGFTINAETKSILTFDTYKDLLFQRVGKVDIPTTFFRHSDNVGMTFTYDNVKQLKFNYEKGFVDPVSLKTYPYGSQRFISDVEMDDTNDLVLQTLSTVDGDDLFTPIDYEEKDEMETESLLLSLLYESE